jgi:hypothetical protein
MRLGGKFHSPVVMSLFHWKDIKKSEGKWKVKEEIYPALLLAGVQFFLVFITLVYSECFI